MTKFYIGIDPGEHGAIATVSDDTLAKAVKMPATERDVWEALKQITEDRYCFVALEKVGPARGKDGRKQGVSSAFKFGMGYGVLRGCLVASGLPREDVLPRRWQQEFGLVFPASMDLTLTKKKNRHKAKAQQLFPHLKIIHAIADALLIAEYARRKQL